MARNFKTHLTGQIGEALVVAALGRRGFVATSFSGNVPDIDILAYRNGLSASIQVKSWREGQISFNAARYIEIIINDGKQIPTKPILNELSKTVFIFVKISDEEPQERFFILEESDLRSIIYDNYRRFLEKHSGMRPRNPDTTHVAVHLDDVTRFEGNWTLIEKRLP